MNDEELNGEADSKNMEDGELEFDDGSAQVSNIRDPGELIVKDYQEHMITHRQYRSLCKFGVMERGVNAPDRRADAQDDVDGVPNVSMDDGILVEGI